MTLIANSVLIDTGKKPFLKISSFSSLLTGTFCQKKKKYRKRHLLSIDIKVEVPGCGSGQTIQLTLNCSSRLPEVIPT